jgi:hypothetical protein
MTRFSTGPKAEMMIAFIVPVVLLDMVASWYSAALSSQVR